MFHQLWFKKVLGLFVVLSCMAMIDHEARPYLLGLIAGLVIGVYFQFRSRKRFSEFFAISSHELRTPLTSMKLQIQMNLRSEFDETRRQKLLEFESQVNRMSGFVNKMQTEAESANINESIYVRHVTTLSSVEIR